jgi:dTDP-4-amino-4,6-dideoxygalactose transaminase
MQQIPLLDLRSQYQSLKPRIDAAVGRVFESGSFILGPEVAAFEKEFAAFCGTRYAVGVNSGTSALQLALLGIGVGPGDEVVTVPFTFVATVAAILYTGARPVFVDVDDTTLTMRPDLMEAAITPRTKAILPVHLYGQPADMTPILDAAARRGIPVIEDAAQAHGAEYQGRRAGSLGAIGCFSFYPGKNLGAAGDGGAIVTDDPGLAATISMLRDWGAEEKYHHVLRGFNYRLDELQAAILRIKLAELEGWTEARRAHARAYRRAFGQAGVRIVGERPGDRHVYHILALRTKRRSTLIDTLSAAGVGTGIHYPTPVHLQKAYEDLAGGMGSFPVAERAADEVLSLPIYPELTEAQRELIVDVVVTADRKLLASVSTTRSWSDSVIPT